QSIPFIHTDSNSLFLTLKTKTQKENIQKPIANLRVAVVERLQQLKHVKAHVEVGELRVQGLEIRVVHVLEYQRRRAAYLLVCLCCVCDCVVDCGVVVLLCRG